MARGLAILAALCLWLIAPATATATPRLCQASDSGGFGSAANQPRPNGVGVTYLYAKLDGSHWTEPPNVCVAITFFDADPNNRYLQVHLWSTSGFFFDLTTAGIPMGTPITLGLSFPANATPVTAFGQWRDGIVGFGRTTLAVQAKTAPWTYVPSAYNSDQTASSGTIDCSQGSTTWDSTFGAFIRLQSLLPDGTEGHAYDSLQGSFFEANTSNLPFPYLAGDGQGHGDVLIDVEGCGDHDPTTLEGHFAGFMATPTLTFLGLTRPRLASESPFMSSLMRVRDDLAGAPVKVGFQVAQGRDLQFEPIDGVTFPALPAGPGPVGLLARANFSFSKHRLDFAARKANLRVFKRCFRTHGTVIRRGATLKCRAEHRRH